MILVGEAQVSRDLLHEQPVVREEVGRQIHPLPEQVSIGAHRVKPSKEPAGVGGRDAELPRGLFHRREPLPVGCEKLPEMLVGGEGLRVTAFRRQRPLRDLRQQHAKQLRAQQLAVPRLGEPALLQEIEHLLDFRRPANCQVAARREPRGPQPSRRLAADEVDVILPQPATTVGANHVRYTRAVGKDAPRCERKLTTAERHRAPARRHEFDTAIRKVVPCDHVIRPHLLHAATDDGQRPLRGGPQVEEVAIGRDDLAGDEGRQRTRAT